MARILFFFCVIALCKCNSLKGLKLKQVLVFSRRNIRTPLNSNLNMYSSNEWPKFNDSDAELSQKGALMENIWLNILWNGLKLKTL